MLVLSVIRGARRSSRHVRLLTHATAREADLFEAILIQLKNCVRYNRYVVTIHAEEEMDEDQLSMFDIECAILNGEIIERQRDSERTEWKYLIRGLSIDGQGVVVVAKMSPNDKMVIITVFKDE